MSTESAVPTAIITAALGAIVTVAGWFVNHWLSRRSPKKSDTEIIKFVVICFSRPAFRTKFGEETSNEDFYQAIEDTVTAINTGKLLDRKNRSIILREGRPYSELKSPDWRGRVESIITTLEGIRMSYRISVESNKLRSFKYEGHYYWPDRDPVAVTEIESLRRSAIADLRSLCRDAKIPLNIPDTKD